MGSLKYVGKAAAADADLVYQSYVAAVKAGDLSSDAIDQAINSGLAAYATVSYVDTRDGLLATQTYIDAQDNLRLKLAQRDIASGWAGLDATGKVRNQLINLPATQKYNRGPWAPPGYGNAATLTTETTLYSVGVTDPGYPYKLIVWGQLDEHSTMDSEYGIVRVRQGVEATGQIIAQGYGAGDANDFAGLGDDFNRADNPAVDDPNIAIVFPSWKLTYINENGTGGSMGIAQNQAAWYDNNNSQRQVRAQMMDASMRYATTDYPRIYLAIGSNVGESQADPNQYVRAYGRANDAFNTYVALEQTYDNARFLYSINGVETYVPAGYFPASLAVNTPFFLQCGTPTNPRRYTWWKGGASPVLLGTWDDTGAVSQIGSTFRNWGFGMRAATRNFGQSTPPPLDSVYIGDSLPAYEPLLLTPMNMTAITGPTTLYVRGLRSGSASSQLFGTYRPKIHIMAVPA